jgi:hypothetical protein
MQFAKVLKVVVHRGKGCGTFGRWDIMVTVLVKQEYCLGDPLRRPRYALYLQKLELTSPTSSDCSVGIVRLQTNATEFVFFFFLKMFIKPEGFNSGVCVCVETWLSSWLDWLTCSGGDCYCSQSRLVARNASGTIFSLLTLARWGVLFNEARWSRE